MKILNLNEYKSQYPGAYLNDYLTYLENMQLGAEEAYQNAQSFPLNDATLSQIQNQIEDIFKIAVAIEEYMGRVVLNSLDALTLEELQTYFDFDEKRQKMADSRKKLEEEKQELGRVVSEIDDQIATSLYENGRVKTFYETSDVADFFKEPKTEMDYMKELLTTNMSISFKEKLEQALTMECGIQNITLKEEEKEAIIQGILELISKSRKILQYSEEATEQIIDIMLSSSGIGKILPSSFSEESYLYLVQDLIHLPKLDTAFYIRLPKALQNSLITERFQGKKYHILSRSYQAFLNGEELPSQDLNSEEKKKKKEIEEKIAKIEYDLDCLVAEERSQQAFLSDANAMRSVLRETISGMLDKNQASLESIDKAIQNAEEKRAELEKELKEATELFARKTELLEEARVLLVDPNYQAFFQAVEKNNLRRVYTAFGVNVTEEVIKPFLDEEKRRYKQIDVLTDLQQRLNDIFAQITTKKQTSNFITRNLPSFKDSLEQLKIQYQQAILNAFVSLQKNGLFYINAPRISEESSVGNVVCLPTVVHREPNNFDEVRGLQQTFWNIPTNVDSNTQKKFFPIHSSFASWEDYVLDLMEKQKVLVSKLFNFRKDKDEYYYFEMTDEEREELKELQSTIVEIATSLYEERKAFRQELGSEMTPLDSIKVVELEQFLGKGANLSRENLANYIDQTEKELERLRKLLISNKSYCEKFGIVLPPELADDEELTPTTVDLDASIKALHIDTVTTLEDAVDYRGLLFGLDEYTVPSGQVKQFYLSKMKINN